MLLLWTGLGPASVIKIGFPIFQHHLRKLIINCVLQVWDFSGRQTTNNMGNFSIVTAIFLLTETLQSLQARSKQKYRVLLNYSDSFTFQIPLA